VTDVLSEGQMVNVKLDGIDERGRLSLTMKGVDQ
jgi:polyribonucleotide nucleotidyltransferase